MLASTFASRLAYVRWLRGRGRMKLETDDEFAVALGVSTAWVVKWKGSDQPPNNRDTGKTIVASGAVSGLTVDWLFDGIGAAPEPKRWTEWLKAQTPAEPETISHAPRSPNAKTRASALAAAKKSGRQA